MDVTRNIQYDQTYNMVQACNADEGRQNIKHVYEWTPARKRNKGQPQITWKQGILEAVRDRYLTEWTWLDRTEKKKKKHRHIRYIKGKPGKFK